MSSDRCLGIRLHGPLQSWGVTGQFDHRLTNRLPSKSAIAGLCCAALGIDRGSEEEARTLAAFRALSMLAVEVPSAEGRHMLPLDDFHTVQGVPSASGAIRSNCVLTRRHYLMQASFFVLLEGAKDFVERLGAALRDPVWGVWLGRKACIPSAPVFAGVFSSRAEALHRLMPGHSLHALVYEEDVADFEQGNDTVLDQPESFLSTGRQYSVRRIRRHGAGEV